MNEIDDIEKTAPDVEKSTFEKTIIQISRSLDIIAVTAKKRWGTILVVAIGLLIYWAFNLEPENTEVINPEPSYSMPSYIEYQEVSTPYYDFVQLNGYDYYTGDTIWYDSNYTYEVVK